MYRVIFLLLLLSLLPVEAQNFLLHEYEKSAPNYVSHLKLVDFKTSHETANYGPINSRSRAPMVLDYPELDEFLLVTTQKKKHNQIHVLDKATLQLKTKIETERLTEEYDELIPVRFISLINDAKELAMVVGKSRKKALVIFDTKNYQEVARFPIESRASVAKLSKNGRYIYFKSNIEIRDKESVVVIDVVNKKKLPLVPQGKGETEVTDFNDYLLVSTKKRMSKNNTTKFAELEIYDLSQAAKQVAKPLISSRMQRFVEIDDGSALLIINRTKNSPHVIELYEFSSKGLVKAQVLDIDVKLNQVKYHEHSDLLLLSGKENMAVMDLSERLIKYAQNIPFNAEKGLLNSRGDKAFFVTDRDSSVVMLDLEKKKIVGELMIGSTSKKVGNVIAKTLVTAMAYQFSGGYVFIAGSTRGTGMLFNAAENKLFVHSSNTQDVTVFDTTDFNDKYFISDIKSLVLMYRNPDESLPIIAATDITTSLVDQEEGTVTKEIEHDHFMGFHAEKNYLVAQKKNKAYLFSTITGEVLGSVKAKNGKEAFYVAE